MAKSVVLITTACAFALLASCQLNDHDSAPRAPDAPYDDDLTQSPSPAEANTNGGGRTTTNSSTDAGADNNVPSQTSGDAALDAGNVPPTFPPIPQLEAGSLPQGNFGTADDGGVIPLPPGF